MRGRKLNDVLTSNALQRRVKDARNADIRVKYCTKCKKCWEKEMYYENFPSYGKIKEICKRCKGEINEQNVVDKLPM